MTTKKDFLTKIKLESKDSAGYLDSDDRDHALVNAVLQYSRDIPREKTHDYAGDGTSYDFEVPDDWDGKLSKLRTVEYPAGNQEPDYLEEEKWMEYDRDGRTWIRLKFDTPGTTETVRVTYTVPHSENTIPGVDVPAVVKLATSYCFRMLAARMAQSNESMIEADVVDRRDSVERYTQLARELEKEYNRAVGRSDKGHPAAHVQKDWDVSLQEGQGKMLYHRPTYR